MRSIQSVKNITDTDLQKSLAYRELFNVQFHTEGRSNTKAQINKWCWSPTAIKPQEAMCSSDFTKVNGCC